MFAGTRQVYGKADSLPVSESHLVRPADVNGINKAAGEYYHLLYNNVFGVRACSLRLTNVYGPRQLLKHNRQGFIAWFIRLAIEDREIQIYGDGSQRRDFVYVDDAADAFLRAGADEACNGQVLNVGGLEPVAHRDLVQLLIRVAGSGRHRFVEWPPEKKAIDIGDFYADSTRIRQTLGWTPRTDARGRPAADDRLLSRAFRSLRAGIGIRSHALVTAVRNGSLPRSPPARGRRRGAGRDRARHGARLVRPRPGSRGVRVGVRRRQRRGVRRRHRHRHRRDRAAAARRRHRRRR